MVPFATAFFHAETPVRGLKRHTLPGVAHTDINHAPGYDFFTLCKLQSDNVCEQVH